jgi:hypothetical protein
MIQEKKAKEIAKWIAQAAAQAGRVPEFTSTREFAEQGEKVSRKAIDLLLELDKVNRSNPGSEAIRLSYDYTTSYREYLLQFVPTPKQMDVVAAYGMQMIDKFNRMHSRK